MYEQFTTVLDLQNVINALNTFSALFNRTLAFFYKVFYYIYLL